MLDRPLVLQSEEDVSSAAFIMSDSAVTREFLRQWWDSAETGCCHVDRDKHDQTAYTHGEHTHAHTRPDCPALICEPDTGEFPVCLLCKAY